ncbi:MAG: hypothetical protein ABI565_06890 [Vicinamibacteria bacterium]
MRRSLAALALGLALLLPACASTRGYGDRPASYRPLYPAYEEGFKRGLVDGRSAGHRDRGRASRRSFWDDGRYRHGSEGYRPRFGSRLEYADGFRTGYEHGYFEERGRRERRD